MHVQRHVLVRQQAHGPARLKSAEPPPRTAQVYEALGKLGIDVPVVLHSWTGSEEMVTTFLQHPGPVYFSLSGYLVKVPPERAMGMVGLVAQGVERGRVEGRALLWEEWAGRDQVWSWPASAGRHARGGG